MSLLADLLSKNKSGALHGTDKSSPSNDIPPTLSKSHGNTSKVPKLMNRYVITAAVFVAVIALGSFLTVKFGPVGPSAGKKTALPQSARPQGPGKVGTIVAVPRIGLTPLAPTTQGGQGKAARITLGEPAASVSREKKPAAHLAGKTPSPPPPTGSKVAALPQQAANPAARRLKGAQQQAPVPAHQKEAVPLKIDTAARDALLYAARSAEQASDWKAALASYRKAQEIDPGNYKIMSNLAAALNNLGMFDEGAQEAERALTRKPDYVPALINAAIGYSSRGNTQKALRLFTTASALDPGNRNLAINLGVLQERAGNLDEAQAAYRPLATAGDPLALEGMGRIYERKGNKSEAARTYRQILRIATAAPALKREVKGKLERLEE